MDIKKAGYEMKEALDEKIEYRKLLYRRGYLVTNNKNVNLDEYPFYSNWNKYAIDGTFSAYVHREQHFYIQKNKDNTMFLIGHAYDPFTLEIDEDTILSNCLVALEKGQKDFFDAISELTGIHVIGLISGNEIKFVQDCTAMKACYYGKIGQNAYFTSHCALISDVDNPSKNEFVDKLTDTHAYWNWGSKYLPGDVTVYNEFKRLGPNLYVRYNEKDGFDIERFFPLCDHPELEHDNTEMIDIISDLIKKSTHLVAKKWDRPAISLTGGLDSRTTLSSSNGEYDSFQYYSFYCKQQELDDSNAAHEICSKLGVNHRIYPIPDSNDNYDEFELQKAIIARNNAYVATPKEHEIRKYIYLSKLDDFDVEIKSWASEIGRAYWQKRYPVKLPEQFTPRDFTVFQTRFLGTPKLMKQNDYEYKSFQERSELRYPMYNYDHLDMFYWEYRFGSNGTYVTMGQDFFNHEVTMSMNNRKIMDMFLWFPFENRYYDLIHKAVILKNEPRFENITCDVHNGYFSKKRVIAEGLYYRYRKLF